MMRRTEYQSCEAQGHLSRVEALIAHSNESRRAARRANRSASAAKPDSRCSEGGGKGYIPASKTGNIWTATRSALREHFSGSRRAAQ
jgi:hypothetical protein